MISAWECFHFATLELVRSSPIKQRLVAAYRRHLAALSDDQIPDEARESFAQMVRSLSGVTPQRGEDVVAASVRKMSNQEADDCAALIVEIFGMMSKTEHTETRANNVVPLHAVESASDDFEAPALFANR